MPTVIIIQYWMTGEWEEEVIPVVIHPRGTVKEKVWIYDYDFKFIPTELISVDVEESFDQKHIKCLVYPMVDFVNFTPQLNITSAYKFKEANGLLFVPTIKTFQESATTILSVVTKFSETFPVNIPSGFPFFESFVKVKVASQTEEDELKQLLKLVEDLD